MHLPFLELTVPASELLCHALGTSGNGRYIGFIDCNNDGSLQKISGQERAGAALFFCVDAFSARQRSADNLASVAGCQPRAMAQPPFPTKRGAWYCL
jgi:hypothetical protein